MARIRVGDSKKKAKSTRVNKTFEQMQINRAYGDEPTLEKVKLTDENYKSVLLSALNWANANFENNYLKEITIDYFKNDDQMNFLKDIPDQYFNNIGKQVWLRNKNLEISEQSALFFKKLINELEIVYSTIVKEKEEEKSFILETLTTEQKTKLEYASAFSMIDCMISNDKLTKDSFIDYLRSKNFQQNTLRMLLEHYKDNVVSCEQFDETRFKGKAIDFNTVLRIKSKIVVDQIEKMLTNIRAEKKLNSVRKPRKRKIKEAAKVVQKLQFKDKDDTLQLVSIPPTNIIGATHLIIFNVRTRKIGCYYALENQTLSIKGTTIQNYDENKSVQKTLRKPNELISHLIDHAIRRYEKVFADIKAVDTKLNGRINYDTLLLKTFK